uniref:Uncharacterized protein n=1 Tax=Arundo donax TaxID=35708 RepID=A0A0A9CGQ0_ARUDO
MVVAMHCKSPNHYCDYEVRLLSSFCDLLVL